MKVLHKHCRNTQQNYLHSCLFDYSPGILASLSNTLFSFICSESINAKMKRDITFDNNQCCQHSKCQITSFNPHEKLTHSPISPTSVALSK